MARKSKKYEILGGIKVSSQQLSEWGSLGGRPKKWNSEKERKRAERLRKKKEKFGEKVELRGYKKPQKKENFIRMICSSCQAKSVGGIGHLGGQCFRCFWGSMVGEK